MPFIAAAGALERGHKPKIVLMGEAVYLLKRGVAGTVHGIGFPPFLGGPFRYADTLGVRTTVHKLEAYRERLGERFEPAPGLTRMAEERRAFYSD